MSTLDNDPDVEREPMRGGATIAGESTGLLTMERFREVLNPEFLAYLGHEAHAVRLMQFEGSVVPGVLQTEQYAESLIRGMSKRGTPEATITRQIEARMARQSSLDRTSLDMRFIVDEAALLRHDRRHNTSADVLHGQLDHLRQLARRPCITIQVLPLGHGFHVGLRGSFVILEFDNAGHPDVLYRETRRPALVHDQADELLAYKTDFEELQRQATPPEALDQTLDAIRAAAKAAWIAR